MATEVIAAPLGEVRAASTAGGGTALSTSAARIALPRGTKFIRLIPRNFSTAVVAKFNKNPFLTIFKTTDALATPGNITDYSDAAQDSSTATKVTLNSLDTAANLNFVYVGSHVPFAGVDVDVQNTNGNASVLTVKYWNGTAWTSISATDATASGGNTFAQDGVVSWTVPTDWATARLGRGVGSVGSTGDSVLPAHGLLSEEMYWTRWEVSAALDSTTDANSMLATNRSTAYAEIPAGFEWAETITVGRGAFFSLTALTDAGTANLVVNCATRSGGMF